MPAQSQTLIDPLAAFIDGAVEKESGHPVPLVSTRFDVTLEAGVAVVSTRRLFRNDEAASIEATITLPVPVHATVFRLEATVDGRTLVGAAQAKAGARETYEDAIDRGKAAVLHEEALRGVHQISVAQIAPGASVEVRCDYVQTATRVGDRLGVRIPTTVGQVYGRSPLTAVDDLVADGEAATADIAIACPDGPVLLDGELLEGGEAKVRLDRPIDLSFSVAPARTLIGASAEGGPVSLTVTPAPETDAPLDLAVLVDRSGSMGDRCAVGASQTKHDALAAGLRAAVGAMGASDRVDLWQFDGEAERLGAAKGSEIAGLLRKLGPPRGGTEVGHAIGAVLCGSKARDLLVITDGQSYALDVQALARAGRRISVVLIGEDSLEARVGHLASLTGGEIFIAASRDVAEITRAALASLRAAPPVGRTDDSDGRLTLTRGGMAIAARWTGVSGEPASSLEPRAIGALIAALRLPRLSAEAATQLAVSEGLVTHLTSLVLVDEAGAAQDTLPMLRKVALPRPAVSAAAPYPIPAPPQSAAPPSAQVVADRRAILGQFAGSPPGGGAAPRSAPSGGWRDLFRPRQTPAPIGASSPPWVQAIHWDAWGGQLVKGDVSSLPQWIADEIRRLAASRPVLEAADRLRIDPLLLVIAAAAASAGGRTPDRIVRRLLPATARRNLSEVTRLL